jgi:hypothetical protein
VTSGVASYGDSAMPEPYIVCTACQKDRAEGQLSEAAACRSCRGRGMVRNPESFFCNGCGSSLARPGRIEPQGGLIETTVSGGYDSEHLLDMVRYTFSLCEKCMRVLFDGFKVPPAVHCYHDGRIEYQAEHARYERWKWREGSGPVEKLTQGLCNAVIECTAMATWRVFNSGGLTDDVCCDEHKKWFAFANSLFVPAAPLAGMLRAVRTADQAPRVATAYLVAAAVPQAKATYFKYVPPCVADLMDVLTTVDWRIDPHALDKTSALWVPHGLLGELGALPVQLQSFALPGGHALVGPIDVVEPLSRLPGVRAAPPCPQLEEELQDDEPSEPAS